MTKKKYPKLTNKILKLINEHESEFDTNVLALINALCIVFAAKHYEVKDDKKIDFDFGLDMMIEVLKKEVPRIYKEYSKIQDAGGDTNELGNILN